MGDIRQLLGARQAHTLVAASLVRVAAFGMAMGPESARPGWVGLYSSHPKDRLMAGLTQLTPKDDSQENRFEDWWNDVWGNAVPRLSRETKGIAWAAWLAGQGLINERY